MDAARRVLVSDVSMVKAAAEQPKRASAACSTSSAVAHTDFFDDVDEILQVTDPAGRLVWVNRSWRSALGYDLDAAARLDLASFADATSMRSWQVALASLRHGDTHATIDLALRARDGRKVLLRGRLHGGTLPDGSPVIRAVLRDVTRRRRAEDELYLFKNIVLAIADTPDLRAALTATLRELCRFTGWAAGEAWTRGGDGVALERTATHVDDVDLACSVTFRRVWHWGPEPALPRRAWDTRRMIVDGDGERACAFRAALAREVDLRHVVLLPALNAGEPVATLGFYPAGGSPPAADMLTLVASVVAQLGPMLRGKAMEDRLRASETLLAEAQAIAHVGSFRLDLRTQRMVWSSELCRIHGIEPGAEPATLDAMVELIHPEDRTTVRKLLGALRDSLSQAVELRIVRPDGAVRHLHVRGRAEVQANSAQGAFIGIVEDVTEKQTLDRLKDEFVSTVSHELRTPLTSIRGALGLLEGGVTGPLGHEAMQVVRIARTSSDRLIRLINDILDLDKMAAGKLELVVADVDPGALTAATFDDLRATADAAGVTLESHVRVRSTLRGDSDRLAQVLTNLVSNAIKHSPRGGRVQVVSVEDAPAGRVRLSVIDRGDGIPADQLDRLFGRFNQIDASDRRARGGTGLGLAICKAIVEQHGGRIGVETRAGEGSTFWFELSARSTEPFDTAEGRRHSVLIVEEDGVRAAHLRSLLVEDGFRAVWARSLLMACELQSIAPSDVVLLAGGTGGPAPDLPSVRLGEVVPEAAAGAGDAWLDRARPREALIAALRRVLRPAGPPRALLVEEDAATRHVMARQLTVHGFECAEATDGGVALELARTSAPDLIVMDVGTQSFDGFRLVDVLRQEKTTRTTPLVVYTAQDLNPTERRALRLGTTRYLTKGRAPENALVEAARQLLGDLMG